MTFTFGIARDEHLQQVFDVKKSWEYPVLGK